MCLYAPRFPNPLFLLFFCMHYRYSTTMHRGRASLPASQQAPECPSTASTKGQGTLVNKVQHGTGASCGKEGGIREKPLFLSFNSRCSAVNDSSTCTRWRRDHFTQSLLNSPRPTHHSAFCYKGLCPSAENFLGQRFLHALKNWVSRKTTIMTSFHLYSNPLFFHFWFMRQITFETSS